MSSISELRLAKVFMSAGTKVRMGHLVEMDDFHYSHHLIPCICLILLMEDILHHLECINLVDNGIKYQSTG